MGLSIDSTKFLTLARKAGVRFDETLTLGRQHMLVGPERLVAILQQYGIWPPPEGAAEFLKAAKTSWRFDVFARALGAKKISSCDASAYEGASLVHDLNQPVPVEWEEKFDVIFDGGTLEHIFNFPVAIANCMKMVKTGGHFITCTPANNLCGHGFYQFSPELFYRVLSPENGFQIQRMVGLVNSVGMASLAGVKYPFAIDGPWYEVRDPAVVGERIMLINNKSALLMILAKKIFRENIFAKTPQQSDYVVQWQQATGSSPASQSASGSRVEAWLRGVFSETFCREILPKLALIVDPFRMARYRRENSFRNRKFYQQVKD